MGNSQEAPSPVAWMHDGFVSTNFERVKHDESRNRASGFKAKPIIPLYAAPQQPMRCPTDGGECGAGGYCRPEQRKPLPADQLAKLINDEWATPDVPSAWKFARAIEEAHGIGEQE